jgi:hypothetical protein
MHFSIRFPHNFSLLSILTTPHLHSSFPLITHHSTSKVALGSILSSATSFHHPHSSLSPAPSLVVSSHHSPRYLQSCVRFDSLLSSTPLLTVTSIPHLHSLLPPLPFKFNFQFHSPPSFSLLRLLTVTSPLRTLSVLFFTIEYASFNGHFNPPPSNSTPHSSFTPRLLYSLSLSLFTFLSFPLTPHHHIAS